MEIIYVKSKGNGDYIVTKGGDVYRGKGTRFTPGTVKNGETASIGEIDEWINNGVPVIVEAGVVAA